MFQPSYLAVFPDDFSGSSLRRLVYPAHAMSDFGFAHVLFYDDLLPLQRLHVFCPDAVVLSLSKCLTCYDLIQSYYEAGFRVVLDVDDSTSLPKSGLSDVLAIAHSVVVSSDVLMDSVQPYTLRRSYLQPSVYHLSDFDYDTVRPWFFSWVGPFWVRP
jgi:hypothetical protein